MRQALHIFEKDARRLWTEIAVVLAATGLLVFTGTHQSYWLPGGLREAPMPQNVAALLVSYLLPLSWWLLIVRVVHAESLTGDCEFWPTRPYSWKSLLAAKSLLVVLFINLPLLAAQAIIIQSHGFHLAPEILGLLWNQLLITVAFILPVATIAALTTGMVQFLLIGLVAFAGMMLLAMPFVRFAAVFVGAGWMGMEWIRTYYLLLVIAITVPPILIWQYARRRTLPARLLVGAVAVVLALGVPASWTTAFAIQSRFSRRPIEESAIRAGLNPTLSWATRALIEGKNRVSLNVPLQVSGVADDLTLKPEGAIVTIEGAGGAAWRATGNPRVNVTSEGQLISLQTVVDESFYQKVKDHPAKVSGYLYLTLYGNERVSKVPFSGRRAAVPGMGICSATGDGRAPYFLTCDWALRPRADLVSLHFEDTSLDPRSATPQRPVSYSPFPADLSLNPVDPFVTFSLFKGPLDDVTVMTLEPLAHVRVPISIDGLQLGAYEARLPRL